MNKPKTKKRKLEGNFDIAVDKADYGWLTLRFKICEHEFEYIAGHLGLHPIFQLVKIAAYMPVCWGYDKCDKNHNQNQPYYFELKALAEPGMLLITFEPYMKQNKVAIKVYSDEESIFGDRVNIDSETTAEDLEATISLDEFYQSVFDIAARLLVDKGTLGSTNAWWPFNDNNMDPDQELWAFPMAQFYYLASVIYDWPKPDFDGKPTFELELELMQSLWQKYGTHHRSDGRT